MKNKKKRQMTFELDDKLYGDFKILCVKERKTMTEVMTKAIESAIELGIYVDLNKKK